MRQKIRDAKRSGDLVAGGWNAPAITSKKMEWCAVAISDKVAARNAAPITGTMAKTIPLKCARRGDQKDC
jgi:hypothetical protein